MTAAAARRGIDGDHRLLDDYAVFSQACTGDRGLRDRLRATRAFLATHPDLDVWMSRPVTTRLADLRRDRAWLFIVWAVFTGRVRIDMDLLAAKHLFGLRQTVAGLWPDDLAAAHGIASQLGWSPKWARDVIDETLCTVMAHSGHRLRELTDTDIETFLAALTACPFASKATAKSWHRRTFGVRQVLYELAVVADPPRRVLPKASLAERLGAISAPEIRRVMLAYVECRSAVLARSSVEGLIDALIPFGEFLAGHHPEIRSLRDLERAHIEEFLVWNRSRTWRGRLARDKQVSPSVVHAGVLALRNMFDDITLWGWAERPERRLIFATDVPRLPRPLPLGLAPDIDQALMEAIGRLDDDFARVGITLLRRAGLRLGELLDLELNCVVDYGSTGTWLRVPLGKLNTERSVPLDADTVALLDAWTARRGRQRPHPNPRSGAPCDYLFAERGQRISAWRIRGGLDTAVAAAGLTGPGGTPLRVTPHQLRHTYATELANAGMSLQGLMALLGHVTPEMTLRYAARASPTLRSAYDEAIGKVRRRIPVVPAGRPAVPTKVEWLASEYLKTRVATGYCSRHLAAEACPYANVCETCDNFVPGPEFVPALRSQLADIHELRADADQRGWTGEAARHARVANALENHIARLENTGAAERSP
jgi:integrase